MAGVRVALPISGPSDDGSEAFRAAVMGGVHTSVDTRCKVCYDFRMWQTFDKARHSRHQPPAVSISSRGIAVNKAAVLLLLEDLPDTHLDFVVLIDRDASQIGLRLYDDADEGVDLFSARRPRTGRMGEDGIRKFTNVWRISNVAMAAAAGLRNGRYEATFKEVSIHPGPAMIVFGPEPIGS